MNSNNEINIRSLKRFDSSVDQILSSATQVAVYSYLNDEWTKLDIEGALFVVSKKSPSNYALIIMNRLSTNNFNEIIDCQWDVTLNSPFLLYKNDKSNIRCVWFYDQSDCKRVYEKLREIVASENANTGFELSKLNIGCSNAINNNSSKPVEETLAKLGIKSQPNCGLQSSNKKDTTEFMRSLIQQTNQKFPIIVNNEGKSSDFILASI